MATKEIARSPAIFCCKHKGGYSPTTPIERIWHTNAGKLFADVDQIAASSAESGAHATAAQSGAEQSSKPPETAVPTAAETVAAPLPPQAS